MKETFKFNFSSDSIVLSCNLRCDAVVTKKKNWWRTEKFLGEARENYCQTFFTTRSSTSSSSQKNLHVLRWTEDFLRLRDSNSWKRKSKQHSSKIICKKKRVKQRNIWSFDNAWRIRLDVISSLCEGESKLQRLCHEVRHCWRQV